MCTHCDLGRCVGVDVSLGDCAECVGELRDVELMDVLLDASCWSVYFSGLYWTFI